MNSSIKSQFTKRTVQKSKSSSYRLSTKEKQLIAKLKKHNHKPKTPPTTPKKPRLKIIALGGFEEVGKNCVAIEYENDIVLIDLGFQFPEKDMLGVDFVLPDLTYIKKNKNKIRGLIISHGHLDHTGGIPYLLPQIGNIPIFGTKLTTQLIAKRLEEFPNVHKSLKSINPDSDKIRLGQFNIEFFRVNHNIPDSMSIVIHSPVGSIVYTGDFKIDFTPATDQRADLQRIAEIGRKGVLVLMSESTNAHKPGHTISEKTIGENLDLSISKCKGRIIIATFSLLFSRIQQIFNSASKYHRKVTFIGRSLLQNFEIASQLKYYKLPKDLLIPPHELHKIPDNKILVVATGSQGEKFAAINRMANGDHRQLKIKKGDTVILSAKPIPGNEKSVYDMIDNLIRQGANIINEQNLDVHASGHGSADDLKLMLSLINPQYLIPDHGSLYARYRHAKLGQDMGMPEENTILLDNGQIAEFVDQKLISTKTRIPSGLVFVDGLGVGDVGNVVIRDRQLLSEDGIIVIIARIKKENIPATPDDIDIISRGFVYMKEADPFMNQIRKKILEIINHRDANIHIDLSSIRNNIRDRIGEFVFEQTQRRPMVIPVTIEV